MAAGTPQSLFGVLTVQKVGRWACNSYYFDKRLIFVFDKSKFNGTMSGRKLFLLDSPIEQSNKTRLMYLLLALSCFCFGLLLNFTYRPYVYRNHINDLHFADVIGNIAAVPAGAFFFYAMNESIRYNKFAILVIDFLIWCFYEVAISATFDWWDILASLIMCFVTYPILLVLEKRVSN